MPPKKTRSSRPAIRHFNQRVAQATVVEKDRFNLLPTELISEIFWAYYHITQAPILLLFVCRRWHDISLSISSFWCTIRFDTVWIRHHELPNIEKTMHWPVTFLSWKQMESALSRTGEAMLNIYNIGTGFDASENLDIAVLLSARCRRMQLSLRFGITQNFVDSFRDLANLEGLSLIGTRWEMEQMGGRILANAEGGCPRMVELEITGSLPASLIHYTSILKRLRRLTLSVTPESPGDNTNTFDGIIEHLTCLRELTWPFSTPRNLDRISGRLRALHISRCSSFPALPFGRLTSLTLRCTKTQIHDFEVVDLPSLVDLTFSGYWARFTLMKAPILVTLNFECWDLQDYTDPASSTSIRPKSLTITNAISEDKVIEQLTGVWSEVEGMHWVFEPEQTITFTWKMTAALGGTKTEAPICPCLHILTVKTVNPIRLNKSVAARLELRLRTLAQKRRGLETGFRSIRWSWEKHPETLFSAELVDKGEDGVTIF